MPEVCTYDALTDLRLAPPLLGCSIEPFVSATSPRILLIMGVAGSGKSTLGRRAAAALGWPYFEADDFHSESNKAKMASGTPLDDADREPWLAAIRAKMNATIDEGRSAVFTCSALKEKYREVLAGDAQHPVTVVFLNGDYETILARVSRRKGHFMKADLVRSQFEALEHPKDALELDIRETPEALLAKILAAVK